MSTVESQTAACGTQLFESAPGAVAPKAPELIPGYELEERIGAGGYGEVWRAIAPGGLQKAVKVIYGMLEESRAVRELRSLERVKEVRHPFLLTLERIEVVQGRLVIVTELADSSLKDRFDQCRQSGQPGIPRDELLAYLRDAADALDFMYEEHSLQHLDIKPENLLLLGRHLKVADFGLLKDLRDTSVSLMGGLTPLYSPPEVFEGRPSRHSDQYSLAIVYQMMLAGRPPFGGRTAAQLTAQHLNSNPDLEPLPPDDRSIIGRALAKNPQARFASCRHLTDALSAPPDARQRNQTARPAAKPAPRTTHGLGDVAEPTTTVCDAPPIIDRPAALLPAVTLTAGGVEYRPSVFVGVGGLGGRVLCRLRRRLNERFTDAAELPALPMVYLDSDRRALGRAVSGDDEAALSLSETIAMPLRAAHDYRKSKRELLEWLSRRWLFNIPRSLQTEGIRPLGRLAFVDHIETVRTALCRAVEQARDAGAIAATAAATGLPFTGTPRVFVVAAVSGGVGSGAVIDVAYTLRTLLSEPGENCGVCGLLLYANSRQAATSDVALANTLACLDELRNFSRKGYPGDRVCGLPGLSEPASPFDETYAVALGARLSDADFTRSIDMLAEYLEHDSVTPARAYFEAVRAPSLKRPAEGRPVVRTLGIARSAAPSEMAARGEIESLVGGRSDSVDDGRQQGQPVAGTPARPVHRLLELAEPALQKAGGGKRFLLSTPGGDQAFDADATLPQETRDACTLMSSAANRSVVRCEVQDIRLADAIAALARGNEHCLQMAARLHTRIDVDW